MNLNIETGYGGQMAAAIMSPDFIPYEAKIVSPNTEEGRLTLSNMVDKAKARGLRVFAKRNRNLKARSVMVWNVEDLMKTVGLCHADINGKIVPARLLGSGSLFRRFKAAWTVLKGNADLVVWPEGQ